MGNHKTKQSENRVVNVSQVEKAGGPRPCDVFVFVAWVGYHKTQQPHSRGNTHEPPHLHASPNRRRPNRRRTTPPIPSPDPHLQSPTLSALGNALDRLRQPTIRATPGQSS